MLNKNLSGQQSMFMSIPDVLPKDQSLRLDLFKVYKTIEANPNITLNQLKFLLSKNAMFPQAQTAALVQELIASSCLGTFLSVKNSLHLNIKVHQDVGITEWVSYMSSLNEAVYTPIFRRKSS